jgi:hypothetical protein
MYRVFFCAVEQDGTSVKITPDELERVASAKGWVDICKGWNDEE